MATSTSASRYEVRGRAAWITLDSPATRNALSGALIEGLGARLARALADDPRCARSCSRAAGRRSAPAPT